MYGKKKRERWNSRSAEGTSCCRPGVSSCRFHPPHPQSWILHLILKGQHVYKVLKPCLASLFQVLLQESQRRIRVRRSFRGSVGRWLPAAHVRGQDPGQGGEDGVRPALSLSLRTLLTSVDVLLMCSHTNTQRERVSFKLRLQDWRCCWRDACRGLGRKNWMKYGEEEKGRRTSNASAGL